MFDHDLQCTNNMVVSLRKIYTYIHICACVMYVYVCIYVHIHGVYGERPQADGLAQHHRHNLFLQAILLHDH
jgi:hypothetical protein